MGRLVEAHQRAAAYYAGQLSRLTGGPALHYLRSRGIPQSLARSRPWRLGYAPPVRTGLTGYLRRLGFADDELIEAGLTVVTRTGRPVDAFRDRLLFPIRGPDGRVRAFVGRDLSGQARVPRYRNTATTPIYTKSGYLYGSAEVLSLFGRPLGGHRGSLAGVILVEGPADAVALSRLPPGPDGRFAAVSTCGTAVTAGQIARLAATVPPGTPVIVCFDPDAAGARAADRAYDLLRTWDGPVDAIVLPPGVDPAALIARSGPRAAARALRDARTSLLAARVARRVSGRRLDEIEGRLGALRAAGALLRHAVPRDAPQLALIARDLAVRLGFDGVTVFEGIYPAAGDGHEPTSVNA
ncbi:toprim domain-containing protein [Cryptosporangium phraense]|uniref:Toprim domain-containing protein n=1 Tax=Cryptosporangium phraense TaxID=2593070 RepID=A0A545AEZ4_9ACTN|nr:toprim domain-containing protein [Cryptosporangium phraense]TQS39830.1 toprim domain-containing protein [Cryptosporangium phraense]